MINKVNLDFLEEILERHDLKFLMTQTFPALPKEHLVKALKIIWKHTRKLKDATILKVDIPPGLLDVRFFPPVTFCSTHIPKPSLFDIYNQAKSMDGPYHPPNSDNLPSITESVSDFVHCCELVLAFRSYFQYSSNHCPLSDLPNDGILPSVELFQAAPQV